MEIIGTATVIARRPHGETAVILGLLCETSGRINGVFPGGASPRRAAMTQPGARVSYKWRARREDQLGTLTLEPMSSRAGVLGHGDALAGLNAVCALLDWALPERDPHPAFTRSTEALLDAIDHSASYGWNGDWPRAYLAWELALLRELGFALDLGSCAVTGARAGLAYVSPRTGRALTAEAAGEWAPRLLALPDYAGGVVGDLAAGFALSGHFLDLWLAPHIGRPVPAARARLKSRLLCPRLRA